MKLIVDGFIESLPMFFGYLCARLIDSSFPLGLDLVYTLACFIVGSMIGIKLLPKAGS